MPKGNAQRRQRRRIFVGCEGESEVGYAAFIRLLAEKSETRPSSGSSLCRLLERASVRLSIDVGGTFTDVVLIDDTSGRTLVDKVPSTPGSARAVIESIGRTTARAGTTASGLDLLLHGFTIATNAWLTRTGGRVVLLTTAGFRDVLALGSQRRPHTYDLAAAKPEPLVPRSRVVEVTERIDAFGQVVTPLDETETARVLDAVAALDPEALAVSLLFAWANPVHERRLAAAFRRRFPDRPVYCSCEVNPEIEEFPRANTTVAAAYVGPPVRQYTESLETELAAAGVTAPLRYMRSDGGSATARSARENPAAMLLSGPAGGVVAARALGETISVADLITFDMGGTSADFSVVRDGGAATVRDRDFDGLPLRVPMLEIKTISAGGGSIGSVDRGGGLRVGPASAGAVPGPACYARGGTEPTLTDAALALDMLDAETFAGGAIGLDPDRAREAIERRIAAPLGLPVEAAARGMLEVATASMAQAIRELSTERGDDVARFSLLAFGGAGGLFAPWLLRDLGLREVLVPRHPGVFAALGLHYADLRHHAQAPFPVALDGLDPGRLRPVLSELGASLDAALDRDGVARPARRMTFSADMRYVGQHHRLEVPLPAPDALDAASGGRLGGDFHDHHERRYGYCHRESPVEITNVHAVGIGAQSRPPEPPPEPARESDPVPRTWRSVPLGAGMSRMRTPILHRDDLAADSHLAGPAIVVQDDSTLVVLAEQTARVGRLGFIHVTETSAGAGRGGIPSGRSHAR